MKAITVMITAMLVTGSTISARAQSWKHEKIDSYVASHKTMAILPFEIVTKDKTKDGQNRSPEQVAKDNEMDGYGMQRSLADYFITKKPKKYDWTVTFQPVEETNRKLKDKGLTYETMFQVDKDSLCKILGVDAVMYCYTESVRTLSDGAAVAVDIFTGYGGYTGNFQIDIKVHDGESGDMVWKYMRQLPTSYWGQYERLIENLMKRTVEAFPWKVKKK